VASQTMVLIHDWCLAPRLSQRHASFGAIRKQGPAPRNVAFKPAEKSSSPRATTSPAGWFIVPDDQFKGVMQT
jgi:hypothetical protein